MKKSKSLKHWKFLVTFVPILVVIVVAKFGSSPSAAANSFKVSNVVGAASTKLDTALEILVSVSVFV